MKIIYDGGEVRRVKKNIKKKAVWIEESVLSIAEGKFEDVYVNSRYVSFNLDGKFYFIPLSQIVETSDPELDRFIELALGNGRDKPAHAEFQPTLYS